MYLKHNLSVIFRIIEHFNSEKMRIILIAYSFALISLQICAQDNTEDKPAYQYWDNRYIDDKIILKFVVDRYTLKDTDSVKATISIENKSDESIFILSHYGLKHSHSQDSTEQTLHFVFGDGYTGGVELLDKLREIEPGEKYYSKRYLRKNDFDYLKNGESFFKIVLGFAYIRSFNKLRENEHFGTFKTRKVGNDIWEASNMVIWLSLYYEIYLTHYVNFKK